MQQEAIHHIQNDMENATSIATLKSLKKEVKYLIEDCDITYLAEVYRNIEIKLTKTINQEKELKLKLIQKAKEDEAYRTNLANLGVQSIKIMTILVPIQVFGQFERRLSFCKKYFDSGPARTRFLEIGPGPV